VFNPILTVVTGYPVAHSQNSFSELTVVCVSLSLYRFQGSVRSVRFRCLPAASARSAPSLEVLRSTALGYNITYLATCQHLFSIFFHLFFAFLSNAYIDFYCIIIVRLIIRFAVICISSSFGCSYSCQIKKRAAHKSAPLFTC